MLYTYMCIHMFALDWPVYLRKQINNLDFLNMSENCSHTSWWYCAPPGASQLPYNAKVFLFAFGLWLGPLRSSLLAFRIFRDQPNHDVCSPLQAALRDLDIPDHYLDPIMQDTH